MSLGFGLTRIRTDRDDFAYGPILQREINLRMLVHLSRNSRPFAALEAHRGYSDGISANGQGWKRIVAIGGGDGVVVDHRIYVRSRHMSTLDHGTCHVIDLRPLTLPVWSLSERDADSQSKQKRRYHEVAG